MQYIKFGFGRASRDGSRALQRNEITKEQFKNYVKLYDHEILTKDILNFVNIAIYQLLNLLK